MAIQQVRAQVNGVWHVLEYNSSTGKYEKTITAPNTTSYNVNAGHYYPVTVEATNTAGTVTTVNDNDGTVGNSLKLVVKEKVKPTINITSPGAGAFVINNKQPIVFQLRDEAGMVCTPVTNGYDCTYTPPSALSDDSHTVTINVSDYDGNAATQASRSYTVDTVPPVLNVTSPANGLITNTAALVVAGNTNDVTSSGVTITIKLNGVDQGSVPVTSGNFSKSITLANGSNTIVVTATDTAGKVTETTLTVTLDTSAPVINSVSIVPNPVDAGNTMIISVEVSG